MQLMNQQQALIDLTQLAEQRKQAVVISGAYAVGKTYLAREYGKLLGIPDFTVVEPKVNDIKSTIDSLIQLETPIVLCIARFPTFLFPDIAPCACAASSITFRLYV